jgi:hypothetical protein
MLILFSARAMTESLYTFLLLVAFGCFLEGLGCGGRRAFAFAAIAMGLAWLTRQEAQFALALMLLAWFAVPRGENGRRTLPGRLRAAVIMVALFAVIAAPFVVLLRAKTGIWTAGAKATVNISSPQIWQTGLEREKHLYRLNADGTERAVDGLKSRSPIRALWENRRQVAARYPANLSASLALLPTLLGSPFLLLLVPLGVLGRRWARERRAEEVTLFLLGLLPIVLYAAFAIDHRYFVPYLPVYLLWAGAGGAHLLQWWKESFPHGQAGRIALLRIAPLP